MPTHAPVSNEGDNGSGLHLVPPMPAAVLKAGGFWRRFVAAFIDGALLLAVEKVIFFAIGISAALNQTFMHGENIEFSSEQVRAQLLAFGIGSLVHVGYCYGFYQWKSATLGKLALGLKVVDFETGERLGLGQTILREFFGKWLSFIPLFGGYFMAAFRRDKRALHDFLAGTQVRHR